jgi:hypothetical protein
LYKNKNESLNFERLIEIEQESQRTIRASPILRQNFIEPSKKNHDENLKTQ